MSIQNYFPAGAQKTPSISVTTAGLITATAGNKSATHTLSSSDDADFIAANILSGKTIFGLVGSLAQGKAYATGTVTSAAPTTSYSNQTGYSVTRYAATVTGLGFTPRAVILTCVAGTNLYCTVCLPTDIAHDAKYARILCISAIEIGSSNIVYQPQLYAIRLTGNATLTSGGFSLPCSVAYEAYTYYAFE